MRVVNQITFEAKDDAEALRLAGERLGKDAVILSTRTVRIGGFMGLFSKNVLMVSAGILQDDPKEEKNKDRDQEKEDTARERLAAFQKLLEFRQVAESRAVGVPLFPSEPRTGSAPDGLPGTASGTGKVIYTSSGFPSGTGTREDSVHLSREGLNSAKDRAPNSSGDQNFRKELDGLSRRVEMLARALEERGSKDISQKNDDFKAGLPGLPPEQPQTAQPAALFSRAVLTGGSIEDDEIYRKLIDSDVEVFYARQLTTEYRDTGVSQPFENWLAAKIRCAADSQSEALGGRKIMLVGPTGVGKTTTIAKLAAIQALWEHRNVLLLTSDTYRIAAVEQLRTYAKILGVPIEVIFETENFATVLEEHAGSELILLDTAGRGQKDRRNLETFETLCNAFRPDAVHLVLAANMKYRDMLDVVRRMAVVPISHVIFTKLDETVSYGALFNILQVLDRPVSFFTTGQNVPNDIEIASDRRLASLLWNGDGEGGLA